MELEVNKTEKSEAKADVNFDLAGADKQETKEVTSTSDLNIEKNADGEIVAEVGIDEASESKVEGKQTIEPTLTKEDNKETIEDSSLTKDPETEAGEITLDEDTVLSFLSEKLGKEIKSIDDLNKSTEPDSGEEDSYLKSFTDWYKKTGRPVEDFVRFQKDYSEMKDEDVVREHLQLKYPTFTKEDISLEMNRLTPNEFDTDEEIASKNLELKKLSISARSELEKLKIDLGEQLPLDKRVPPDVKKDLELLKEIEIKVKESKEKTQAYKSKLADVAKTFDKIQLKVSDDLTLNYNIPEQMREDLSSVQEWKNGEGELDPGLSVENSFKVKNFDHIVKLVYEQGLNSGKESLLKETKNATIDKRGAGGSDIPGQSETKVEGNLDRFLGKSGMTIRLKPS